MAEYIERTCKDCIHYDMCKYRPLAIGVDICDVFRDTADVVPRAEVEKLNKELDELAEEHSDLIVEKDELFDIAEKQKAEIERLERILNSYALQYGTVRVKHAVIDKAKAEVAREIFAEIEEHKQIIAACFQPVYTLKKSEFEALKKKYTEGEPNG